MNIPWVFFATRYHVGLYQGFKKFFFFASDESGHFQQVRFLPEVLLKMSTHPGAALSHHHLCQVDLALVPVHVLVSVPWMDRLA